MNWRSFDYFEWRWCWLELTASSNAMEPMPLQTGNRSALPGLAGNRVVPGRLDLIVGAFLRPHEPKVGYSPALACRWLETHRWECGPLHARPARQSHLSLDNSSNPLWACTARYRLNRKITRDWTKWPAGVHKVAGVKEAIEAAGASPTKLAVWQPLPSHYTRRPRAHGQVWRGVANLARRAAVWVARSNRPVLRAQNVGALAPWREAVGRTGRTCLRLEASAASRVAKTLVMEFRRETLSPPGGRLSPFRVSP